jgi:hypothetical protein
MTAQQLDAHAAQILQLSVCDPNSTAVIDLQQQHKPASGYSNAGGASHESQAATPENSGGNKRKRRPAGTPGTPSPVPQP